MMNILPHSENNMWASGACWLTFIIPILKPLGMWDMSQTPTSRKTRPFGGTDHRWHICPDFPCMFHKRYWYIQLIHGLVSQGSVFSRSGHHWWSIARCPCKVQSFLPCRLLICPPHSWFILHWNEEHVSFLLCDRYFFSSFFQQPLR